MKIKALIFISITFLVSACSNEDNQTEAVSNDTDTQPQVVDNSTVNNPDLNNLTLKWEATGLRNPESIVYDKKRNRLYVSNVDGAPLDKDGKGSISILSLDGKIIEQAWIIGLDAPKGLAMYDDKLYAADLTALVEIDIEAGIISNYYPAKEAKLLNDVTARSNGEIYVADTITSSIYRLKDGIFEAWINSSPQLENPNGLLAEEDRILVAAWGIMTDGFKTEIPGHLKSVNYDDKTIKSLGNGTPVGNLDGIENNGNGDYYVTDWMIGKLFLISPSGAATELLQLEQGLGDLTVLKEKNLMILPLMFSNKLLAYTF
jgi:sugar lactone lactonase YvrE